MAIHSGTIAWKVPWTEEPRRLQSMGSQSRTQLSDFTYSLTQFTYLQTTQSRLSLFEVMANVDQELKKRDGEKRPHPGSSIFNSPASELSETKRAPSTQDRGLAGRGRWRA